jgi:hypothetical protein
MIWVILVIIVFVWIVVGGIDPSTSTGGTVTGGNPFAGCVDCRTLNDYWNGLSPMEKVKMAAWCAAKRATCFLAC